MHRSRANCSGDFHVELVYCAASPKGKEIAYRLRDELEQQGVKVDEEEEMLTDLATIDADRCKASRLIVVLTPGAVPDVKDRKGLPPDLKDLKEIVPQAVSRVAGFGNINRDDTHKHPKIDHRTLCYSHNVLRSLCM